MKSLIAFVVGTAMLGLFAGPARADSIAVTSGQWLCNADGCGLDLTAEGLIANARGGSIADVPLPGIVRPGNPISMTMTRNDTFRLSWQHPGGAFADIDGVRYSGIELRERDFTFTAPTFASPAVTASVPFAFTGTLEGWALAAPNTTAPTEPLFSRTLHGQGALDLVMFPPNESGDIAISSFAFVFSSESPNPTPEPASVLLLGTGLAAVGGAAWRRRRRGTSRA